MLLRLVSPRVLVSKLGAIASPYFGHGAVEAERLDATHVHARFGSRARATCTSTAVSCAATRPMIR
ncbi:hypothetical protein [Sandaracinus amylolyticus]|uniref:Uncharacterized protein n=1 Tax=Sandaracinus amylolyticus TaxID=927083 RepID=A0A0F6W124_9BACT|nr:hypothetical protein [Sandaracinus amylolyticus]AKF04546.1 hypothetical protein DB32_001695 [Sandaracinus amylolyticus]